MNLLMEDVLDRLQQLPSLPALLAELLESFGQEGIAVSQLVEKIGRDQGLSARILRVANSPFYGFSSHVGSIRDAVVVVGFNGVRAIAVASGLIETFSGDGLDSRAFWQHGIGTALGARVIAKRVKLNEDAAFTSGLLHDIGKLVLELHFRENFLQVLARCRELDCEIVEAEKSMLGLDHALVGFEVAKRWRFPPGMQLAIRNHHNPDGDLLTDVVHIANVMCHALEIGNSGYDFVPRMSPAAWRRTGLDFAMLQQCFREIEGLNASSSLFLK